MDFNFGRTVEFWSQCMTPVALDQIKLQWRDHRSALWWLGLLYRRPQQFNDQLKALKKSQAAHASAVLYLHALSYIVLLSFIGRWLFFSAFGLELQQSLVIYNIPPLFLHILFLISGIWLAMIIGVAFGLVNFLNRWVVVCVCISLPGMIGFAMTREVLYGLFYGIYYGLILGVGLFRISSLSHGGIFIGLIFGSIIGIVFGIGGINILGTNLLIIAEGPSGKAVGFILLMAAISFPILTIKENEEDQKNMPGDSQKTYTILYAILCISFGLLAGVVTGKIAIVAAVTVILLIILLRAYYYPFHLFFIFPVARGRWYPQHPVAWDDLCFTPFLGLDHLLVAYAEYAPEHARREIKRLIDHYPSQRMAALLARTRLIARAAAQEPDLTQLEAHVAQLPAGDKKFLSHTPKVQEMISEISQLQRRFNNLDRLFLRGPVAALLVRKIGDFQNYISRLPRPLASEFGQAADQWCIIAESQQRQAQSISVRTLHPAAFQAGGPVDRNLTAFVLRESVISDLKRQLVVGTDGHALILTGKSTGKSTLLQNLQGFLPLSLHVATISMKELANCHSQDFVNRAVRQTTHAILPSWLDLPVLTQPTLPGFEHWLLRCNAWMAEMKRRLLLAIDGYEILDRNLSEGSFYADLMTIISASIQKHEWIIWCFTGNRALSELKNHHLVSCLTSASTLEIPPLTINETYQLLIEPLRHSVLWAADDPKRPQFNPIFWSEGGIEYIHAEAGGWPHLVQLLAETVVDLCNDRGQERADQALLEQTAAKAIITGDAVLRQLMQPEDASPNEWAYLCGFRTHDTQPPPDDELVCQALRRRLLVNEEQGQWRLRAPLMQRWLRERG